MYLFSTGELHSLDFTMSYIFSIEKFYLCRLLFSNVAAVFWNMFLSNVANA